VGISFEKFFLKKEPCLLPWGKASVCIASEFALFTGWHRGKPGNALRFGNGQRPPLPCPPLTREAGKHTAAATVPGYACCAFLRSSPLAPWAEMPSPAMRWAIQEKLFTWPCAYRGIVHFVQTWHVRPCYADSPMGSGRPGKCGGRWQTSSRRIQGSKIDRKGCHRNPATFRVANLRFILNFFDLLRWLAGQTREFNTCCSNTNGGPASRTMNDSQWKLRDAFRFMAHSQLYSSVRWTTGRRAKFLRGAEFAGNPEAMPLNAVRK